MKRFLLKITIWSVLSFLALNAIAFGSLCFLGKSNLYKPQYLENGVKETVFDYVILGSSTGLTTLDSKQIDADSGKKGLNISLDDTSLSSHYVMLQHFYALGKKTDYLVLAITPWDISDSKPTISNNDYRFLPDVDKTYVHDYYGEMEKGFFKPLFLSRYFPLFGVSYYNTEVFYPSLLTVVKPEKRNRFDEKGNYSYPDFSGKPTKGKRRLMKGEFKNPYFHKIAQLCKRNNTELILYQSPLFETDLKYEAAPENLKFVNHYNILTEPSFYDNIHVNQRGRKICSQAFAKEEFLRGQHN